MLALRIPVCYDIGASKKVLLQMGAKGLEETTRLKCGTSFAGRRAVNIEKLSALVQVSHQVTCGPVKPNRTSILLGLTVLSQ